MRVSTARRTWARWLACAGPWQGWSVCPALLAPGVAEVSPRQVRRPGARAIAAGLAESLMQKQGVLLALEFEPILGINVAALLYQWRVAHGVLVLPRWPYAHAVLPVDGLLHALASQARRLAGEEQLPNVAFVLDAARSRSRATQRAGDRRADNRYRLAAGDLPGLADLRARGIREVRKVSCA